MFETLNNIESTTFFNESQVFNQHLLMSESRLKFEKLKRFKKHNSPSTLSIKDSNEKYKEWVNDLRKTGGN